jgi:hypothetical protein
LEKGGDSTGPEDQFVVRKPLSGPFGVPPGHRIPATGTDKGLYQNVISWARTNALKEANEIRQLGGGSVIVFVIAIGEPSNPDATARLDANARCLLARIANDPGTIVSCDNVYETRDGDSHKDLSQNWPCASGPCIDSSQQKGQVFTVDMNGNVEEQMKDILATIAALLKLRLTV